jgi:4-oxalocrotonate tautomerase
MPYINVKITAKPDVALSARIARDVTELTKRHLGKDPTVTAIAVDHVDPTHWFIGARSLSEQGVRSFWLDIKVTAGTNTKQELAAYIEAIYAALSDTLGGVHSESYVLVHEVPASAYGFAGKTQEFRFIAEKLGRRT